MKRILVSFIFSLLFISCKASKPLAYEKDFSFVYSYSISTPTPYDHYVHVSLDVDLKNLPVGQNHLDLKMPVWTPGSYLVREFARHVEGFSAETDGAWLVTKKLNKNTWRVSTNGKRKLKVSYKVYANELSVRTSHIDASHAYLNGASVFMYIPQLQNEAFKVKVNLHDSFSKVSVPLPTVAKNTFVAENYDLLVDSFFEIGNQEELQFKYEGVTHKIANYSLVPLTYNKSEILESYEKIVKASHSVFGGKHPCTDYLFLVHHLPQIGGGLEHLNGTTCQTSAEVYADAKRLKGFWGLIAHEYFHLWNVKRLRPEALGPFDYETENYSNMLWVSEGFTAFYQDDILRKAGIITPEEYLSTLNSDINNIENTPGNKVQSVAESSLDAWVKFYRPNENSNNTTISYYTKGAVLAAALNAIIIDKTAGKQSLDNVMADLYQSYYLENGRGFSDEEFRLACEKTAGTDLKSFFQKHIFGTETIPYVEIYKNIGIDISTKSNDPSIPAIGAQLRNALVIRVDRGGSFYEGGINTDDLILKIEGKDFDLKPGSITEGKKAGDKVQVTVLRRGQQVTLDIVLKANAYMQYMLSPNSQASELEKIKLNKFLNIK